MACKCGSQKRAGAVEFLNPNDIGVLCSLFGLEGALCRLLDLVPDAIKKIVSLNPDTGNADQVFGDVLKSVAKKSFGLVIDEAFNQIPTAQFCANEPPEQMEDINYSDIFIFIAELVPILERFFAVNDVLTGNSTKLLDKIVSAWLRQKWYENCECKKCPEPDPLQPPPPYTPPSFTPPPNCDDGSQRCKNLELRRADGGQTIFSCHGFTKVSGYERRLSTGFNGNYLGEEYYEIQFNDAWIALEDINTVNPPYVLDTSRFFSYFPDGPNRYVGTENDGNAYQTITRNYRTDSYSSISKVRSQLYQNGNLIGDFSGNSDGLSYDACPPSPPPDFPPPEFCSLFPDDPLCVPDTNCDTESVTCVTYTDCGIARGVITLTINKTGNNTEVTVSEFSECGTNRITKTVVLLDCNGAINGCTDPNATNYDSSATIDDGSCVYAVNGCTDPNATNYNPYANNDDGSCVYYVYGCMDSQALNYNRDANNDDGSCQYPDGYYGCTDSNATNFNPDAITDDGSCQYPDGYYGCTYTDALNYNPDSMIDDGSCVFE